MLAGTLIGALVGPGLLPEVDYHVRFLGAYFPNQHGEAIGILRGAVGGAILGFMIDGLLNDSLLRLRRLRRYEILPLTSAIILFAYGLRCWYCIFTM